MISLDSEEYTVYYILYFMSKMSFSKNLFHSRQGQPQEGVLCRNRTEIEHCEPQTVGETAGNL